jgi:hypothetical protein
MLCKIFGFHRGDYEKWRLLGYKDPVRTSRLRYRAQPVNARLEVFSAVTMKNGVF